MNARIVPNVYLSGYGGPVTQSHYNGLFIGAGIEGRYK